jgi:hypothetical protein
MLFGKKDIFAIELELENEFLGQWLLGHFCYWTCWDQIGNYDQTASLRDVLFQMKWIAHDAGNRNETLLRKLTTRDVFYVLDDLLYGNENAKNIDIDSNIIYEPARFSVKINAEPFDNWKIYLMECSEDEKLMVAANGSNLVNSYDLPKGYFDAVFKESYSQLMNLYETETD